MMVATECVDRTATMKPKTGVTWALTPMGVGWAIGARTKAREVVQLPTMDQRWLLARTSAPMWRLGMRHATATRPLAIWATLPSTAGMATIALRVWTSMAALVCVRHHATGLLKNGVISGLMGKRGMDGLVMDAGLAIGAMPLAQQHRQEHHQETITEWHHHQHHLQTIAMVCHHQEHRQQTMAWPHQEHHHQQGWSAQDPLATV